MPDAARFGLFLTAAILLAITLSDSPELMDEMIDEMIGTYGSDYKSQWHSLSDDFREGMMNGIIGFEIIVKRLEGKYKLSQNRWWAVKPQKCRTYSWG